jgi:hypothetical protein
VVVDFGDTLRADSVAEDCSPVQAQMVRSRAVKRLEELLRGVCDRLDFRRDLLIVFSPSSRSFSDLEDERLTPAIIRGPGFGRGILRSPSTRRTGVVIITDLAPTVISFLGATPPRDLIGRPVASVGSRDALDTLLDMNLRSSLQAQRQVTMRGGSIVQSSVVVLVTLAAMLVAVGPLRRTAEWAALVPAAMRLSVPPACLASGALSCGQTAGRDILTASSSSAPSAPFSCSRFRMRILKASRSCPRLRLAGISSKSCATGLPYSIASVRTHGARQTSVDADRPSEC